MSATHPFLIFIAGPLVLGAVAMLALSLNHDRRTGYVGAVLSTLVLVIVSALPLVVLAWFVSAAGS